MIIVGAKGFAKEVLEILYQLNQYDNVCFFDDVNSDISDVLYKKFKVLKSDDSVKGYFKNVRNKFTIGIGTPKLREKLLFKFNELGGEVASVISPKASIGNFGNEIANGCNIMTNVVITNDVKLGKCCLINLNSTIGHDCKLGDFVELSPNVNVSGNCIIGDYTSIGTNVIILPNIKIGNNCLIGAGTVVTKNIPDNSVVVGVPGEIIRQNT